MSLNRVRNNANDFGYRLLTPNGEIIPLKYSDLNKYRADDSDDLVMNTLYGQTKALDNLDIPVIMAGKGGSIIIASHAETAEKASAQAFPVSEYDRTPRQVTRSVERAEGLKENLLNNFDFASSGQFVPLPLKSDFRAAVRPDNIVRLGFGVTEDIRLAA